MAKFVDFCFLLLFLCVSSSIALIVDNQNAKKKYTVETETINGVEYAVLSSLCDAFGYSYNQNVSIRAFICSRNDGSQTLTIIENNRFVVTGDSQVVQLPAPPVFINGKICIPVSSIKELFASEEISIYRNEPDSNLVLKGRGSSAAAQVPSSHKGIKTVECSVKQNGTLLTIELSDSLPFDYMYYHPNLIINFFGGSVDTTHIRITEKTGIVQSVSSVQFKESAQISIVLSKMIEDPLFDYVQDTKTVMVSLRPLKQSSSAAQSQKQPVESPKKGTVVVLDPGHGGKDPGAIGFDGIKEKDVVLSIALDLRDKLKNKPGIKVLLTRDKDIFIPLQERTQFANDKKADLFLSVHADAVPGDEKRKSAARGYKVYFLSQAKNEEDKLVAMRENAVIELEEKPQNYSNLQNVLIDIAGNEFLSESQDLCILVDQKFTSFLKKKIEKLHLGVGQANFWVLNGAYMPSVLVETGFLSNPEEAKLLADKEFQKSIAAALAESILSFAKRYGAGL